MDFVETEQARRMAAGKLIGKSEDFGKEICYLNGMKKLDELWVVCAQKHVALTHGR